MAVEIVTQFKRYQSVGHCIYCGTYSRQLEKEHIIPFGLASDSLVLPKASCRTCADLINKFETACLQHMWWPFRKRIGAPTRRKNQPEMLEIRRIRGAKVGDDGVLQYQTAGITKLPPTEFPLIFYTFVFTTPGILIGRDPSASVPYDAWGKVNEEDFRKQAPGHGEGFRAGPEIPGALARMIAKIAHAYAVAELGEKSFNPLLRGLIRGERQNPFHLVGGELAVPEATEHFHEIGLEATCVGNVDYLIANIRLFAFIGAPQYRVVVGELYSAIDQKAFLTKPLYAIDIKPLVPPLKLGPLAVTPGGAGG
jgi:hypothetical protein